MEKPRKPSFPPHRRLQSVDVKKSSSSLNMSTSSLRSINEGDGETGAALAGRRPAVVRFAPATPTPSRPSSSAGTRRSSLSAPRQAPKVTPPAPATTARPASASGPKAATSRSSPAESGPKGMRRSWGWTGSPGDQKERENGDPISAARVHGAATPARSSSVPRRKPTEEKPLQQRESRTNIISRTKAKPSPSPKPDAFHKPSTQRSLNIAGKNSEKDPPSSVSPDNMVKVSTSTTKGASWESLPPALNTLGSGVMSYRDAAEMAAVEAMQEASAAEIVLRCLRYIVISSRRNYAARSEDREADQAETSSAVGGGKSLPPGPARPIKVSSAAVMDGSAFADLAASAANCKQSPQHTVDEFFALQAAITRSTAVLDNQQKRSGHAGEWLHAAVTSNLAPFSLYAAASSSRKHGTGSPRTVAAAEETTTWLETAARELGEEMCAWFAGHVERLIDGDVAGTLGQLKRVNDWLDDDVGLRPGEDLERLRKKIFGYLLDHVEWAVVALNGGVATNRNRRK